MDFFMILVYIFAIVLGIFQIVVLFKINTVCNYIISKRDKEITNTVEYLVFLNETGNEKFNEELIKFIYNKLNNLGYSYYANNENYKNAYNNVINICKYNNFKIPSCFEDLDTFEKFNKKFKK